MQEINFIPVRIESVLTTSFRFLVLVVFIILIAIIALNAN
jgi:hypothetical protein